MKKPEKTDFFEVAHTRHSYRGAFKPTPVAREALVRIIEAGRAAPSACHHQSPRIVAIDDPALMDAIKSLADFAPIPDMVTARAFLLVVRNPTPVYGDTQFSAEDCGAVATNMLNAIHALGLASVWIAGVLRAGTGRKLDALLNIPAPFASHILLPVGVPESPGSQPERKPFSQRVGWNAFTPEME